MRPAAALAERLGLAVRDLELLQQALIHSSYLHEHRDLAVGHNERLEFLGDSILGNGAHLGAGVVLSNLRLDQKNIFVRLPTGAIDSGLRKFGAILGDGAEIGCNAVLNPGTLLGPCALVMPSITVGGYVPPATIAHVRQAVDFLPRRD